MSFLRNSPPGCPFRAIRPYCNEKLPAPWEGGTHFLTATPSGGVQKFYGNSEGGYAFFTFPEKDHPP